MSVLITQMEAVLADFKLRRDTTNNPKVFALLLAKIPEMEADLARIKAIPKQPKPIRRILPQSAF